MIMYDYVCLYLDRRIAGRSCKLIQCGLAPEPFGPREDHLTDDGKVAPLVYSMSGKNGQTHAISECLRSGSFTLSRSDSFLTITETELSELSPRSDFFSPRFHRSTTQSDSASISSSFSPAALDKLCEVVDGAKVKFLGTPVFGQGESDSELPGRTRQSLEQIDGGVRWPENQLCVSARQENTRLWRSRHKIFRTQS